MTTWLAKEWTCKAIPVRVTECGRRGEEGRGAKGNGKWGIVMGNKSWTRFELFRCTPRLLLSIFLKHPTPSQWSKGIQRHDTTTTTSYLGLESPKHRAMMFLRKLVLSSRTTVLSFIKPSTCSVYLFGVLNTPHNTYEQTGLIITMGPGYPGVVLIVES